MATGNMQSLEGASPDGFILEEIKNGRARVDSDIVQIGAPITSGDNSPYFAKYARGEDVLTDPKYKPFDPRLITSGENTGTEMIDRLTTNQGNSRPGSRQQDKITTFLNRFTAVKNVHIQIDESGNEGTTQSLQAFQPT
mmetsp:Transcript_5891/g.9548  ORF Transcript_5891/g.9548 Transcript_5891/m.9548 type:complete len:139 (+) Transcript_5891:925-1341(+)